MYARTLGALVGSLAAALTIGCVGTPPTVSPVELGADPFCSQMHRDFGRWLGTEQTECGPDLTGRLELTPLGNGYLLSRKRFQFSDDLWHLTPAGSIDENPVEIIQADRSGAPQRS